MIVILGIVFLGVILKIISFSEEAGNNYDNLKKENDGQKNQNRIRKLCGN